MQHRLSKHAHLKKLAVRVDEHALAKRTHVLDGHRGTAPTTPAARDAVLLNLAQLAVDAALEVLGVCVVLRRLGAVGGGGVRVEPGGGGEGLVFACFERAVHQVRGHGVLGCDAQRIVQGGEGVEGAAQLEQDEGFGGEDTGVLGAVAQDGVVRVEGFIEVT